MEYHHFGGWGYGLVWALLNFLFWAAIIGLAIWAVLRLTRSGPTPRHPSAPAAPVHHRETAREILDRRFASGEIDAATYEDMRARIEGFRTQPSPAAPAPRPAESAPQPDLARRTDRSSPAQPAEGSTAHEGDEPPAGEGPTKQL